MIAVYPSQGDVQAQLIAFLRSVLPEGIEIFEGNEPNVPEPSATDFVIFECVHRQRLSTNVDKYADAWFEGSISGDQMTITKVIAGTVKPGAVVFGINVLANTTVVSGSSGGTGVYTISPSQNGTVGVLATGVVNLLQPTQLTFQIDVHSNVMKRASDIAQRISTAVRDIYATTWFDRSGVDMAPLYAEDPRHVPFINAEQQYEARWIVEACFHVNQALIDVPQQFFDKIQLGYVPADIFYPA